MNSLLKPPAPRSLTIGLPFVIRALFTLLLTVTGSASIANTNPPAGIVKAKAPIAVEILSPAP